MARSGIFGFRKSHRSFLAPKPVFDTHRLRGPSFGRFIFTFVPLQPGQQHQVVTEHSQAYAGGVILKALKKTPSQLKRAF